VTARFFLFYGGSSVELSAGETIVGRDPRCRLRIHAPWVSRRHARFRAEGRSLWVDDLGSRNGTRVNGDAIHGAVALEVGDEVALGSRRVTLIVHDDEPFELDTAVVDPFREHIERSAVDGFAAEPTARVTQELDRFASPARGGRRSGRDRRRHPRHTLELQVRYESEALQVEAVSLNLSSSGVFIQTPILDEVGTRCRLTVLGADVDDALDRTGEVRRVGDNPRSPEPLGLGIEFADLEDSARVWLESTISERLATAP
jgi:pSer/pThr/pTyr-binding forkhead associated (FHA) protein